MKPLNQLNQLAAMQAQYQAQQQWKRSLQANMRSAGAPGTGGSNKREAVPQLAGGNGAQMNATAAMMLFNNQQAGGGNGGNSAAFLDLVASHGMSLLDAVLGIMHNVVAYLCNVLKNDIMA